MIKVSIIGVTGYTGIELLRILLRHPEVEICDLMSRSYVGKKISEIYPQFTSKEGFVLKNYEESENSKADLIFTALPHGISQTIAGELYHRDLKIIDLSGDFRYKSQKTYEEWYEQEHEYPELLEEAVYGLVELNYNKIKNASLIANPGCYPTASILGILPLLSEKVIKENSIIIDAKSGVSGAGKSLKKVTHFIEANESIKAYGITTHRHTSEIEEQLGRYINKKNLNVCFTPHLVPMKRGILATIYAKTDEELSEADFKELYNNFYQTSEFVQVLEDNIPDTKHVAGSNYCHLGVNLDHRNSRVIITSAIDNLGKGAAGQAVQNMNVMFDMPEETGLKGSALFP